MTKSQSAPIPEPFADLEPPDIKPEPKKAVLQVGKESDASANVFVISPPPAEGNYQITIRSQATRENIDSLLTNIEYFEKAMLERGWAFKQIGDNSRGKSAPAGAPPAKAAAPQAPAAPPKQERQVPQAPAPQAPAPQAGPRNFSFERGSPYVPCDRLMADVKEGTPYWEITSARKFPGYPTRVWPEVINEHFDFESLDPYHPGGYDLTGYVAEFSCNKSGNPAKVIKLYPPGD